MTSSSGIKAMTITLDDLDKLVSWDANSANQLYALVDMGSNGIRFTVSDLSPPRARLVRCLYRERAAISLFDALQGAQKGDDDDEDNDEDKDKGKTLPAETIALVARTIARFHRIAVADFGVKPDQFEILATEAIRRAANADAMVEALRAAVPSLHMYVLAPEVETLFGAVGARSSFLHVRGLFLELGGGSVQMTYMDSREAGYERAAARAGQSFPFGAARLTRILQNADDKDHVREAEVESLRGGLRAAFETLCVQFPNLAVSAAAATATRDGGGDDDDDGIDVYLSGGGFRGYGAMLMYTDAIQPYPVTTMDTYTVAGDVFAQTARLREINASYSGKVFGMSRRRREQFPAIATVVEALLAAVPRIRSAVFCAGDTREGALLIKLPRAVREANPLGLLAVDHAFGAFHHASDEGDTQVRQAVLETLRSALPEDSSVVRPSRARTVFSLDLGGLLAPLVWRGTGEREETNAPAALHEACSRDPGYPGLTHLARAVLAVAACVRWGAKLPPIDQDLYRGLRALIARADPDAVFWAEYMGAVAATVAMVVPAWPKAPERVNNSIRFRARAEQGAHKLKIFLDVFLDKEAAVGIDKQEMADLFEDVGKHDDKKVTVTVESISDS